MQCESYCINEMSGVGQVLFLILVVGFVNPKFFLIEVENEGDKIIRKDHEGENEKNKIICFYQPH